jgi:uncharacterized membrane protein YqgA involved in biofilm formation
VRGLGTVLNIVAILVGSTIGSLLGSRLPKRTADTITDGIGLIVLVVAALNIVAIRDPALQTAVGTGALLIVLGAVILGGLIGSLASLETRFEGVGDWLAKTAHNRVSWKASSPPAFYSSSAPSESSVPSPTGSVMASTNSPSKPCSTA